MHNSFYVLVILQVKMGHEYLQKLLAPAIILRIISGACKLGKFKEFCNWSRKVNGINGRKYSRMDQVKFVERQPLKNFTWSILEYFALNQVCRIIKKNQGFTSARGSKLILYF